MDEVVRGLDESDRWSKDVSRKEDKLPECIYLPEQEPEFYGPYDMQYKAAGTRRFLPEADGLQGAESGS